MSYTRIVTVTDSSNIESVSYDVDDRKMRVKFLTGGLYEYDRVFPQQFAEIVSASSVGSQFSQLLAVYVWPTTKVSG